jgi:hypothetical protein
VNATVGCTIAAKQKNRFAWTYGLRPASPIAQRRLGAILAPKSVNSGPMRAVAGGLVCIAGAHCQALHRQPLDFNDFHSMFLMTYAL